MLFGEKQQVKCRDCKRVSTSETSTKHLALITKNSVPLSVVIFCDKCWKEENTAPIEYIEQFYFQKWFSSSVLDKDHLKLWREAKKKGDELEIIMPPLEL